ncbi:MAG: amino acid permease [Planctomycetota bacterium]
MAASEGARRFGAINGVFIPCVMTIFGVILFLRTDKVVGNAGLYHALLVLAISEVITMLTALSLSAISTNTQIGAGGPYYMISRSLGIEVGAAVGFVFFLGRSFSIALYVFGFTETLVAAIGSSFLAAHTPIVSLVTCSIIFICAYIGADWVIKIQYFIFACLILSLGMFLVGGIIGFSFDNLTANLTSSYKTGEGFWIIFALFFPATIGIMAGANMSGDLKEPGKSIPVGTLAAIGVTGCFYAVEMLLFAGNESREVLLSNVIVMERISPVAALVTVGIFAATLSSALSSFIGAPRVLQAFAADRVFKGLSPFAKTSGKKKEPRPAVISSFLIALIGLTAGDLESVAPVITIFFLVTFGLINWATFYEGVTANPSFRPQFKLFHWGSSLIGACACAATMFLISPFATIGSIVGVFIIMQAVKHKRLTFYWGDARRGFLLMRIRNNLLRLEEIPYHPKNWRPNILVFSGNPIRRINLIKFAEWLESRRGICTVIDIVLGDLENVSEKKKALDQQMHDFLVKTEMNIFTEVVAAPDLESGIVCTVQAAGFGTVRPNTVFLGWSESPNNRTSYASVIRLLEKFGKSVVVLKCETLPEGKKYKQIDVWWRGQVNGSLMLTCAFLLKNNDAWSEAGIRIIRSVPDESMHDSAIEELNTLIENSRIKANPEVVVSNESFDKIIEQQSNAADLVILGMGMPKQGAEIQFMQSLEKFVNPLQRVLLVHSAGDISIYV